MRDFFLLADWRVRSANGSGTVTRPRRSTGSIRSHLPRDAASESLNFLPNLEPNPHFNNPGPRMQSYSYNSHSNDGLLTDVNPPLPPTSTNSVTLSPLELHVAGNLAESPGCLLAYSRGQNASPNPQNMNTAIGSQCASNENAQEHGESSMVIADSEKTGALQQVMTTALKSSRRRDRVPVFLKTVNGCKCLTCYYVNLRIYISYLACQDKAHSNIELCENLDCDDRYGTHRIPPTEHLFKGHERYIGCRCDAQNCNFVSHRWSDLRRHHATKHCIRPKIYPCPELFCDYSGENGFKRLDKLKDHHRKVHEGKLRPGKAQRRIQSAATKPAVGE